ncbi:hypothetical protein D1012_19815 [Pseudotabrizicola alkalilacus]|uniref:Uncharacterized protein n=1 Tax=Pseudotabrizicola alkalilacus TaxID=2305252 RepID=A0A411YXL4_9RHOB|nr:hypothetical protein D1012_19815 [Pseudotabrizicola alkalilacus]
MYYYILFIHIPSQKFLVCKFFFRAGLIRCNAEPVARTPPGFRMANKSICCPFMEWGVAETHCESEIIIDHQTVAEVALRDDLRLPDSQPTREKG